MVLEAGHQVGLLGCPGSSAGCIQDVLVELFMKKLFMNSLSKEEIQNCLIVIAQELHCIWKVCVRNPGTHHEHLLQDYWVLGRFPQEGRQLRSVERLPCGIKTHIENQISNVAGFGLWLRQQFLKKLGTEAGVHFKVRHQRKEGSHAW